MNRLLVVFILLQLSCSAQSPFGSGSNTSSSSSCASGGEAPAPSSLEPTMLEVGKLKLDPRSVPVGPASAKVGVLSAGTKLDLLYDLNCLEQAKLKLKAPVRVVEWELENDMSINEIAELAEGDFCLIEASNSLVAQPYVTPNDTQFSSQAHHTAIRSTTAWDIFYSSTNGITTTTVIAIIDSGGEHAHPDLLANRWTNTAETSGNSIDDDGNGYVDDIYGYNFKNNIGDPSPIAWAGGGEAHGTHVAGISAARYNNGVGVTGVMGQNIQIMHLNVFGDSSSGSSANIVNGIYYAINNGAKIINMSLGGQGRSSSYQTALTAAVNAGVTVIAAAGNSAELLSDNNWYSPASYARDLSGMVAVASVHASDLLKASYSNYSPTFVEISAPGNDTSSTGIFATLTSSAYGRLQGTSMAAPVVAGAAALVRGLATSRGTTPTPAVIENLLVNTSAIQTGLIGQVKGCKTLDLRALALGVDASYP